MTTAEIHFRPLSGNHLENTSILDVYTAIWDMISVPFRGII